MIFLAALFALSCHLAYETFWIFTIIQSATGPEKYFWMMHCFLTIAAALLCAPYFKRRLRLDRKSRTIFMIFVPLLILPLFGSCLIWSICLLSKFIKKDKKLPYSPQAEEKELFSLFEFAQPEPVEIDMQERIIQELNIEPYLDILKGDNVELKRDVLNKLSTLIIPESVKLLQFAIHSDNIEIRLIAAKSLSKIEEMMNDDLETVTQQVKRQPKSIKVHNEKAQTYFRYAVLGLLDSETERFYYQTAIHALLISLQLQPKQKDMLLLLGKIFLKIQNYEKAQEIFKRAIEESSDDLELRLQLCEAYLGNKKYDHLIQENKDILKRFNEKNVPQELISYWSNRIA